MVVKNQRGLSRTEFYHNARILRKDLTALTLRDFGTHSRGQKLPGSVQEAGYYDEIITEFAHSIRDLLRNLMLNITAGNRYPATLDELKIRRMYQNAAITNCEQLLQELLYCEEVLPIKASGFVPYIEKIEFEIQLLRGWRKSNGRVEEAIIKKVKGEKKEK